MNGTPAVGAVVDLTASAGTLAAATGTSDADGVVTASWTPQRASSVQTLNIHARNTNVQSTFKAFVSTSLVGQWSGTTGGATFSVNITRHDVSVVTPTSPFTGNGLYQQTPTSQQLTFPATGDATAGNFLLLIPFATFTVTFSGQVQNNDTRIVGTLNGGPYQATAFTMTKQ